jgi:hypothetical protein
MKLECPHCHAVLEFTERRPSFCGYCGQSLSTIPGKAADAAPALHQPQSSPTVDFDPEGATVPPTAAPAENFEAHADPDFVGGYHLLRPIGSGGMGTVYEAEECTSGRHVALKLVSAGSSSRDAVERFRREGRLASAIQHPRCVFVLTTDEDAGRPYIVMELMSGATLHDLVKEKGPLAPDDAIAKILDVIDGLREAHQLGVIHRDMKPSNCFLEDNGRVKVGDFGLAKSLLGDSHLTKTGAFMGTALFASPEQVRADQVDQQSDVYAVAATLYFLLTGKAPHQTGDAAATLARIVADPAPSMRTLRSEVPAALDQVVLRGLERSRERRWRNLDELRRALLHVRPGQLRVGALGLRFAAYLIDWMLAFLIYLALFIAIKLVELARGGSSDPVPAWGYHALAGAIDFLYFAVLEGALGCSLGKRWLGLRIRRADLALGAAPGWGLVLLRTTIWYVLILLPWRLLDAGFESGAMPEIPELRPSVVVLALEVFTRLLGMALLFCTMRPGNGYQGLHDWLTGTRVVQVGTDAGTALAPEPVAPSGWATHLRRRVPAFVIDVALFAPFWLLYGVWAGAVPLGPEQGRSLTLLENVVLDLSLFLYWVVLEGFWGWSLGKRWLRLRVSQTEAEAAPGLVRGMVRALVVVAVFQATDSLTSVFATGSGDAGEILWFLGGLGMAVVLLGSTMRPGNGYRGLHELLSGTRVRVLPWPARRRALQSRQADRLTQGLSQPTSLPKRVGPFAVHGALRWTEEEKVLLGEDTALGRKVGILLQPLARGSVEAKRRDVGRPTRLRWLASGQQGEYLWDAFLAPAGSPLADVVSPDAPLTWAETRPLLEQLIDELLEACEDGTLPQTLGVDQIWVQPNGRLQLLGTALSEPSADAEPQPTGGEEERALELLRRVAVLALEGTSRPPGSPTEPVRAPLPEHAAVWLDRLLGVQEPYNALGHVQFDLTATRDRPTQVSRAARVAHLSLQALLHVPGLLVLFTAGGALLARAGFNAWGLLFLGLCPVCWILWAYAWRGGLTFHLMGLSLVRRNGRKAWRLQCAWRALLVWAPVVGLLSLAVWLASRVPEAMAAAMTQETPPAAILPPMLAYVAALALPVLYLVLAILYPTRNLHDRLAGTYLVPK